MVKLIVGHKGSGKTKIMVDMANAALDTVNGSIVFIHKDSRLMYDLKYKIRSICMDEFIHVTNIDEYIGFIYGIISQDHDIEEIYIDGILKHVDVEIQNLEEFINRLINISKLYGPDFIVSVSAERNQLGAYAQNCEIIEG